MRDFSVLILNLIAAVVCVFVTGCGSSVKSGGGGGGGGGNTNPTTVTVTFKATSIAAVAVKIGSGSFTPATLSSNTLTLSIPQGTTDFAVAYLCPTYPSYSGGLQYSYNEQYVIEGNTQDATSFTESCPPPTVSQFSFEVDASAISGAQGVLVETGNQTGSAYCSFDELQTGARSCIAPTGSDGAFVEAYSGSFPNNDFEALAVRRYDGQTAPGSLNNGAMVALGAADLTTSAPITYQNLPSGFAPDVYVYFDTATEGDLRLAFSSGAYLANYPVLPAAAVESGDYYSVQAQAWNGNSAVGETVDASGGAASIVYPAPWSYSGPSPAALPVMNFSSYSGFNDTTGLDRHGRITWSPSNLVVNNYRVSATANAAGGSASVAFPDLSSVSGFLPNPGSGTNVDWLMELESYSAGVMAQGSSGTTRVWVENEGSYVVP